MIFTWWLRLTGVDLIIASKMNEIVSLKNILEYCNTIIWQKDEEIKRLTNLILTEHGVMLRNNETRAVNSEPRIINKKSSWPQRQRELERADAQLAKQKAATINPVLEKHWNDKNEQEGKIQ